jgi:hypothetical protein
LEISEADIQGKYELSSIVRDTVTRMITIEKPLQEDVVFNESSINFEDENCNLLFSPIPFKIPADSVLIRLVLVNVFRKEISKLSTDH